MKLSEQFEQETGTPAINSQGEPDIDYVQWLEDKVNAQKLKLEEPIKTAAHNWSSENIGPKAHPNYAAYSGFIEGAEWQRQQTK